MSIGPEPLPTLPNAGAADLGPWGRWGIVVFLGVIVAFSGIVERRSAFSERPMTDLQVYLRAAWTVRADADLYTTTDSNGWHYHYPPLLAILLSPLADPPPGSPRDGAVPFALSVAIWYWFSVACLFWGVHALCHALERTSSDPDVRSQPPGCRRWRALRILPILACLPAIGQTLARGQVNLFVLALLCGLIAAVLRGRRFQAGLWLAGAICIKVIPAFLLIYPLWRRDLRGLAGCALGLCIGLGAIPAAVLGPGRTVDYFQEWTNVLVRPALGEGEDQSRANELINVTATDSQSFLALVHNGIYPNRATRPAQASDAVRWVHRLIVGALTLLTLLAAGWSVPADRSKEALLLGLLTVIMVMASPVCHLHYFCLTLPLATVLLAWQMGNFRGKRRYMVLGVAAANLACTLLPVLPGMDVLRDHGLAAVGTLSFWMCGLAALWAKPRTSMMADQPAGVAVGQAA